MKQFTVFIRRNSNADNILLIQYEEVYWIVQTTAHHTKFIANNAAFKKRDRPKNNLAVPSRFPDTVLKLSCVPRVRHAPSRIDVSVIEAYLVGLSASCTRMVFVFFCGGYQIQISPHLKRTCLTTNMRVFRSPCNERS